MRALVGGLACGIAVAAGVALQRGVGALALLPAALSWGAGVGAVLVALHAGLQRARGRELSLRQSSAPALSCLVAGAGGALAALLVGLGAMGPNVGAGTSRWPALALVGLAVAANGGWRLKRGNHKLLGGLLSLVLALLAAEAPREAGLYSLSLASTHVTLRTDPLGRARASEDCKGINLSAGGKRRPRTIAGYHPRVSTSAGLLHGNLGALVGRALGAPKKARAAGAGAARFVVTGALDFADYACYTPLFRRVRIQDELTLAVRYSGGGKVGNERWAISCRGAYPLSLSLSVTMVGVASCRDVMRTMARSIAEAINKRAARIAGHLTNGVERDDSQTR